jgi:pimeloyl-ACP methyl ester carboxylesterase
MISLKSGAKAALATILLSGCGGWVDTRAERREAAAEAAYPPEGEFVDVGGGRQVHAVVRGSGPDLVLIHGASGNTRDFTLSFADRLTDRYRVIVFDRPGFGYTDRAAPQYGGAFETRAESPAEQAAMLDKAAEVLGASRPIVLGHSYGGAVAMAWGLDHDPAALVVVSGVSQPWPGGLGALYSVNASSVGGATVVPLISAFAGPAQADRVLRVIFAPQPVPEGYKQDFGVGLSIRRESLRANARQISSLKPHVAEMSERYSSIDIPIEIVHGAADRIVPARIHSIPLSEQVESARLTLLDGIGHMPHHVAPDALVDAVDRAARRAGLR